MNDPSLRTDKRTVTIELTNWHWALLARALRQGCESLGPTYAKEGEHIYKVVGDALYPE
jgi:hypothetical protein